MRTALFILTILLLLPFSVRAAPGDYCVSGNDSLIPVPCFFETDQGLAGAGSFSEVVVAVIQILLYIVASISVLFLIIGGFRYVTAHGNEEQAEAAKKTIIHSIIGLIIVILSFAIIAIITNILVAGQL